MSRLQNAGSGTIEVWGGLECTINRVRDQWFDQFALCDYAPRIDAIDRVAELGIQTLRYPFLWERIAPGEISKADWKWSDARMNRMRQLRITPIAGLMHHGSGPSHTNLLDSRLPQKLCIYAAALAERYGDLQYVTPINEPLTTARFSTLYGHWYPHHRSSHSFAIALLRQIVAVRDSMRAMRDIIPDIKLVQTEDLGKISSTPELEYQAAFENERRWLTFDLLCGRLSRDHPMWSHLAVSADAIRMLTSLEHDPCPPDIIGINYYITSDRFLDHRVDNYPHAPVGGNGRHSYVDVESVRVADLGLTGHATVLCEAARRYSIPVALTEVHLACTREQQVQWLLDAWNGAHEARAAGCDVRAITAWSLMGSRGWDKLLIAPPFAHESGAFDTSTSTPRRTAVGAVVADLATRGETKHISSNAVGWWRSAPSIREPREILLTGSTGTLGNAFARILRERGVQFRALTRRDLDITNADAIRESLKSAAGIINAAGFVRVDEAELDSAACFDANARGPALLARECAQLGIPLLTFSSDLVFDGSKQSPYVESDTPSPLNIYGKSKAHAESAVLDEHPEALIIRTSAFFGPWDEYNFASISLKRIAHGLPVMLPSAGTVSPTYVPDLVRAALDLLMDGESGIWHLANNGAVSWRDFAATVAARAGILDDPGEILFNNRTRTSPLYPAYSALGTERAVSMPPLDDAITRYVAEASIPAQIMVSA